MSDVLERMRGICLALPDAKEGKHFESVVWKVGGQMFASRSLEGGTESIVFALEPPRAKALLASDARYRKYPRDSRGIVIAAADIRDWKAMSALLRESYDLVLTWAAAKKQKQKPKPKPKKATR